MNNAGYAAHMKTIAIPPHVKLVIGLAAAAALAQSPAAFAQTSCSQHYAGAPPQLVNVKLQAKTRELCSTQFAVLHSGITRTPIYSAELLTRETVRDAKEQVRYSTFHPDPRLPADERSDLRDFVRSGFDRGHMAPSGNMPTLEAQQESFALSNIIPQYPQNNRYLWAGIESATRQMAKKATRLYVISGAMFTGAQIKTVGGRVMVPTHLFKAIYNPKTGEAAAYLVRNDGGGQYAMVDLATIERLSRIRPFSGAKFRVSEMALPAPITRGSKASGYQRVTAESIMMTGNGYGSAAPDKNSHKHPMAFANLGLHPASQMVQTVFKQFLQK